MPRISIALLVTLVVFSTLASAASAATVAREGSEIVFRATPGASHSFSLSATAADSVVRFTGQGGIEAGAGCAPEQYRNPNGSFGVSLATCPTSGVTLIRVLTSDGGDRILASSALPLAFDLGGGADELSIGLADDDPDADADSGHKPTRLTVDGGAGNDKLVVGARSGAIRGGEGDDRVEASSNNEPAVGPFSVDGGSGDDTVKSVSTIAKLSLMGGTGNDKLTLINDKAADVSCGSGVDSLVVENVFAKHRIDGSCPPSLASAPRKLLATFSGASGVVKLRPGLISRGARILATMRRLTKFGAKEVLARGRMTVQRGRPQLVLRATDAGAVKLRRSPRMRVYLELALTPTSGRRERAKAAVAARTR